MMKVALLLLACLGLAAAQANGSGGLDFSTGVNCASSSGGCTLNSLLTIQSIAVIVGNIASGASINLDFSVLSSGSTVNIDNSGGFSVGSLTVGTLSTGTAVVNIASGFVVNTGSFLVQQGANVTVSGTVAIQGAASGAVNTTVAAGSSLYVAAGGQINAGASTVQSNGNTTVQGVITAGTYTQNSASLILNAAAGSTANLVSSTNIQIQGGATLSGNGALGGAGSTLSVGAGSTISVGNSPGVVTINGDWRPSSTSVYKFEVASAQSYDQLVVTGKAYLTGIANCIRLNNFEPQKGARFYQAITAGNGIDNSFSSTLGSTSSDLSLWSSSVNGNQVIFNFNSATSVVISAFVLVACVLASLL